MTRILTALLVCLVIAGYPSTADANQKPAKKPATKEAAATPPSKSSTKRTAKEMPPAPPSNKSVDPVVGKTATGKAVYEGSRGGFYFLTESGNRSYVQDFIGAKIVGKTTDGKNIYEGPRGGRFYYNDKGDKIYQKKK
jgi:colicin import membrane protein